MLFWLPLKLFFEQNTLEISTVAFSSAGVLVADIQGSIHVLDKDFEILTSWVAHIGGRVTHMVEREGILITFGVSTPFIASSVSLSNPFRP